MECPHEEDDDGTVRGLGILIRMMRKKEVEEALGHRAGGPPAKKGGDGPTKKERLAAIAARAVGKEKT